MTKKIFYVGTVLFLVGLILCFEIDEGDTERIESSVSMYDEIEIGVSLHGMRNKTEKYFIKSIIKEACFLGLDPYIYEGNSNSQDQIMHIKQLIEEKVDGIILCPFDKNVAEECIGLAMEEGIPVVLVDSPQNYKGTSGYVWNNFAEAGVEIVEEVAKLLDRKGNIVILEDTIGKATQIEKQKGMNAAFKLYPDLNVISAKSGNGTMIEAQAIMKKWLSQFDKIDAVICQNDEMAIGASKVIKTLNQDIVVASIGGTPEGIKAVECGDISVLAVEDIEEKGRLAIHTVIGIIFGEDVNYEHQLNFDIKKSKTA